MAHALVWHELDYNDTTLSDATAQLPYVDMGTINQANWNIKLFQLKWINSSVDNAKLWLNSYVADLGVEPNIIPAQSGLDLVRNEGFKFKYILLDEYNATSLPDAKASTYFPLTRDLSSSKLQIIGNHGQYFPAPGDYILLKNQQGVGTTEDNGLYFVSEQLSDSYTAATIYSNINLAAGYGISANGGAGVSYYLSYSPTKSPGQAIQLNQDSVIWTLRNTTDIVSDVKYATTTNHTTTGSGSGKTVYILPTEYLGSAIATSLELGNRVLVKSQTNFTENGIYLVRQKYIKNNNSIPDPRLSTNTLDSYWANPGTGITALIKQGKSIEVAVLHGDTFKGKTYRYYPDNSITNDYRNLEWSESSYHYQADDTAAAYFEITSSIGSTIYFSRLPSGYGYTNFPKTISVIGGTSYQLQVDDKLLVKDTRAGKTNQNGLFKVTAVGTGCTLQRYSPYNTATGISDLRVYTTLSTNSYNGNFFFIGRENRVPNTPFNITADGIAISDRPLPFKYYPCNNILSVDVSAAFGASYINENLTGKGAISTTDRILITNQADPAHNGIYIYDSGPTEQIGLGFTSNYRIQQAGILTVGAGYTNNGKKFMLYSTAENGTVPGGVGVTFFDITSAYSGTGYTTVAGITTVNKLNTTYISPTDFNVDINNNERVLVSIGNTFDTANGIYVASVGTTNTYRWQMHSSFAKWWSNVDKNEYDGIEKYFLGQNKSLYYVNNFETITNGNIYIPQPITNKKQTFSFDDRQLENYELDWVEQEYQKYYVRAVIGSTTIPPSTSGTAAAYVIKTSTGTTTFNDGDPVLVVCNLGGAGISDLGTASIASTASGIYKAKKSGSNVYFIKHADWNYVTTWGANGTKTIASPYERPSLIRVKEGHVTGAGSAVTMSKTVYYMQAALGVSNTATTNGYEIFTGTGSTIYITSNYNNMHLFPKLGKVDHYVDNPAVISYSKDLTYGDVVSLTYQGLLNQGVDPDSNMTRILVNLKNDFRFASYFGSQNDANLISGIYEYYAKQNLGLYSVAKFKKVNHKKLNGHIDYYKDLSNNGVGTSSAGVITFALQSSKDTNFTWHPETYPISQILVSNGGPYVQFTGTSSLGCSEGVVRITADGFVTTTTNIAVRLQQTSGTIDSNLANYNYTIPYIGGFGITGTYWQQKVAIGNSFFTSFYEYTASAGTTIITPSTATYIVDRDTIFAGSATSFLFMRRSSFDSSYSSQSTTSGNGTFYPTASPPLSSTLDFFIGPWSLENNDTTNWYSIYKPDNSTSIIDNLLSNYSNGNENIILVLQKNKNGLLSSAQQSSYNKDTSLYTRQTYGKNDQYVLQFKNASAKNITLTYDTSFPNPIVPKRVRVGTGDTYILYYNPSTTSRSTALRRWFVEKTLTNYGTVGAASTSNINLENYDVFMDNETVGLNTVYLLKNQNNPLENGLHHLIANNYYTLQRPYSVGDKKRNFYNFDDLIPYSQVDVAYSKGSINVNQTYELQTPQNKPYTIWMGHGGTAGTAIHVKLIQSATGFTAAVASTTSYNNVTTSTSIPDVVDNYSPGDNEKILLLSQDNFQGGVGYTTKYLARFSKQFRASLERTAAGTGASEFSIRSFKTYQNSGVGSSVLYESYFNPNVTTVGVGSINFINYATIVNYPQADYISNHNVSLSTDLNTQLGYLDPLDTSIPNNKIILLKDQSDLKENSVYYSKTSSTFLLDRHSSLNASGSIQDNLTIKVLDFDNGRAGSANYGIWYSGAPTIDVTPLYFVKQYYSIKLGNVQCATEPAGETDINLVVPPTSIDNYQLQLNDRILVKNQDSNPEQNGIYYVSNLQANTWQRASDLNSDIHLVPQLNVRVENGQVNSNQTFVINLTTIPREVASTTLYPYIIGTDPIAWTNVNNSNLFYSNPNTWTDIPDSQFQAISLNSAKLNQFGYSLSQKIALAVYVPLVSGVLNSTDGKVRNMKLNVEYDIAKD